MFSQGPGVGREPPRAVGAHLVVPQGAGAGVEGPVRREGCVHGGADGGGPVRRGRVAEVVQAHVEQLAQRPAQPAAEEEQRAVEFLQSPRNSRLRCASDPWRVRNKDASE